MTWQFDKFHNFDHVAEFQQLFTNIRKQTQFYQGFFCLYFCQIHSFLFNLHFFFFWYLFRCSQPRVGLCGQRCRFDEDLFVQLSQSTPDEQLYVIDCRDSVSALGNKAKGMLFIYLEIIERMLL